MVVQSDQSLCFAGAAVATFEPHQRYLALRSSREPSAYNSKKFEALSLKSQD